MTPVHLLFLFGALPAIVYADILGIAWIRSRTQVLDGPTLQRLHYWIYFCLLGIIITGVIMLSERAALLGNPVFITKMVFVLALVMNSLVISWHMGVASSKSYAVLAQGERRILHASAAVSIIGWVGAIACGLLLG